MSRKALVIGGGVAGLQASLDLAGVGVEVYLVEREPRIGGLASMLYKLFPTMSEASELVEQMCRKVIEHPNIRVLPYAEVVGVEGSVGNFKVRVSKKARYVVEGRCTACGKCEEVCPIAVPKEYEMGLATRKAIYLPSPYPAPRIHVIDRERCLYFKDGSCHACQEMCPEDAISFEQKNREEDLNVDVIIVATGIKPYDARRKRQYGYGIHRNVITGIEYERMCSPNGPTKGMIVRVDNQERPRSVAFLLCIGSREERNHEYCCRVGCLNALKHALLLREQYGDDVDAYICYTDIRAVGKGAEEFYRRVRELGITLLHGEPSEVRELPDKSLTMDVYDQATSKLLSINADLVVLEVGLEPETALQKVLNLPMDQGGFFKEAHPKLATNETPVEGVFLAGSVQQPMSLTEAVVHASAAAMKAIIAMRRL